MKPIRVLVTSALAVSLACARPSVSPDVEQIWRKHENVVVNILAKQKYREEDLVGAVAFFEKTTGLKAPGSYDEKGLVLMPTDELPKNLARWQAWYRQNKEHLYLDAASGEVRLR